MYNYNLVTRVSHNGSTKWQLSHPSLFTQQEFREMVFSAVSDAMVGYGDLPGRRDYFCIIEGVVVKLLKERYGFSHTEVSADVDLWGDESLLSPYNTDLDEDNGDTGLLRAYLRERMGEGV